MILICGLQKKAKLKWEINMSKSLLRLLKLPIILIFFSWAPTSLSATTCACYCNNDSPSGHWWEHIGWAWTPNGCTGDCVGRFGINKGCCCWGPGDTDCWNGWGTSCNPRTYPTQKPEKPRSHPTQGNQNKTEMKERMQKWRGIATTTPFYPELQLKLTAFLAKTYGQTAQ